MATVVSVAKHKTTIRPGRLYRSDLDRLWQDAGYPDALRPVLLDLLHGCEVAYPARDGNGQSISYSVVPGMIRDVGQPGSVLELLRGDASDEQVSC